MKLNEQFESVAQEMETLDTVIREQGLPDEVRARWGVTNNPGTWCVGRKTAEFLFQQVLTKRPKLVLELGTSIGYSTIWLAAAAKEVGGEVATVEKETYKMEMADEFIVRSGMSPVVRQIQGDISDVLDGWEEPVDFVFIDAGKRGYLSSLKKLEPWLNEGAVIIADNMTDMQKQVQDYIDYVTTDEKYHSTLIDIDHGLMISIYKKTTA